MSSLCCSAETPRQPERRSRHFTGIQPRSVAKWNSRWLRWLPRSLAEGGSVRLMQSGGSRACDRTDMNQVRHFNFNVAILIYLVACWLLGLQLLTAWVTRQVTCTKAHGHVHSACRTQLHGEAVGGDCSSPTAEQPHSWRQQNLNCQAAPASDNRPFCFSGS